MTTKHTPGPWNAYNMSAGRILMHWRIGGPDQRELSGDGPLCIMAQGYRPEVEAANARLIAAAPDLLSALERCVFALESPLVIDVAKACLNDARAAIAKARGA